MGTHQQLPVGQMTLAKLQPATLNMAKLVAFLLLALGIAAFAFEGVRNTAVAEKSYTLPLPVVVGLVALIAGFGTLWVNTKCNAWPEARVKRGSRI